MLELISNFSLLLNVEIYRNKIIIPPKKIKIIVFIAHKDKLKNKNAPTIIAVIINIKDKTRGCEAFINEHKIRLYKNKKILINLLYMAD